MSKLDRKTLDQIGKALVAADMVSPRDIDEIAANPALFDSVRARIRQSAVEPTPKRVFPIRALAGGMTGLVVIAVIVTTLGVLRSKPLDVVVQPVVEAPRSWEKKTFSRPDVTATTDFPREPSPIRAEKISTRPTMNVVRQKQPEAQQVRHEGEFYALSYAGDPNETEPGGRIVRVDIPRSTLFAMGVDVPLENGPETVKADLLIGSDGVTRAIRIVK